MWHCAKEFKKTKKSQTQGGFEQFTGQLCKGWTGKSDRELKI